LNPDKYIGVFGRVYARHITAANSQSSYFFCAVGSQFAGSTFPQLVSIISYNLERPEKGRLTFTYARYPVTIISGYYDTIVVIIYLTTQNDPWRESDTGSLQ
jgi:hypothetical protein